jgi:ArpU family phage transcriptional regulator
MEREQTKRILLFCRDIDGEIFYYQKQLQAYEDKYYSMSSGSLTESYIKSRNKVSRPTEAAALNISDAESAAMHDLRAQIEQLAALKTAIYAELNKLPLPQKSILHDFYIRRLQWVQISSQVHYSEAQCKRIRNSGLDKLANNFQKNALIKNFIYPQ